MVAAAIIDKSKTSETSEIQGKECTFGEFISEADGWKIIGIAATWEGTPYSMVGGGSSKGVAGDCSGTTQKIYVEAGFPYPYQSTAKFATFVAQTNRFRKINMANEKLQVGDILLWPGHMAIYTPFPAGHPKRDTGVMMAGQKKFNDMYTAFNSRTGTPYGPYNIEVFRRDAFAAFRYLITPKTCP